MVQSHQGPNDYIEPKSTWSINMATPSGRPSMITPSDNPQSPHIIPSDYDSICYEHTLPITTDIQPVHPPTTKYPTTETSDETLHKNSVEPLFVRTLNLVKKDATNIPPVPPSSTPAPCKNRTKFESLNLHRIFGCHKFQNQNHLTWAANTIIVNSGLLPYTFGSFATIANPPREKNKEPISVP